jgi:hypothetical protein
MKLSGYISYYRKLKCKSLSAITESRFNKNLAGILVGFINKLYKISRSNCYSYIRHEDGWSELYDNSLYNNSEDAESLSSRAARCTRLFNSLSMQSGRFYQVLSNEAFGYENRRL